jgi:hypothetical protein
MDRGAATAPQTDRGTAADPVLSTRVTTAPAPINRAQRILTASEEADELARIEAKERAYQRAHPTPLNF